MMRVRWLCAHIDIKFRSWQNIFKITFNLHFTRYLKSVRKMKNSNSEYIITPIFWKLEKLRYIFLYLTIIKTLLVSFELNAIQYILYFSFYAIFSHFIFGFNLKLEFEFLSICLLSYRSISFWFKPFGHFLKKLLDLGQNQEVY